MLLTKEQFNQVINFVWRTASEEKTTRAKHWTHMRVIFSDGSWLMASRKSTPPMITILTNVDKDGEEIHPSIVKTNDKVALAFAKVNSNEIVK